MSDSRRLVWRYYAFRTTNSAGFYVPIAILYLKDQGFGLDFIGFAYAVFAFATLLVEIPTGYLGDWLGRRGSLAIGSVLRALVLVGYPLLDGAVAYLALHVVWATGRAFRSGTQDAWLYELLKAHLDRSQFARIEGRGSSVLLATSAVGAIVGASLYTVEPAYPFFVNAGLAILGVPLLFTFPAVETETDNSDDPEDADEPDDSDVFTVREAVRILRLQVGRPEVRWLVAYAGLFNALFLVTRVYEQPALDAIGVPVVGLGFLYAGFKIVSAGAASTAGWVEDRLGTRGVFALLVPVYGLAYASIAVAPLLILPVFFLNRGLRVVTRPIRNQYLNDRLDDVGRATVLSGASMVFSLVGGVARLVAGWATEAMGPVAFFPWAGVAIALTGGILWLLVSPVRSGETSPTANPDGAAATD